MCWNILMSCLTSNQVEILFFCLIKSSLASDNRIAVLWFQTLANQMESMENIFIFFVGLVSFLQVSQTMIYFLFDIFTIHPCRFFICQTLSKFLLPSLGRIFGSRIKSSEGEFREPSLTTGFRKGCKQLLFIASLLDINVILSNQMICESKYLRA